MANTCLFGDAGRGQGQGAYEVVANVFAIIIVNFYAKYILLARKAETETETQTQNSNKYKK